MIVVRYFTNSTANGPGDLGSIPGRIIAKTLKIVLDTSLYMFLADWLKNIKM